MRNNLTCLIVLLLAYPWPGNAQNNGFPYTTLMAQDLKDFKPTGNNWKIAGDVFYDLKEGGKGRISSGKGVIVNDLSGKSKDHLFTQMEHGDIDLELEFMMDKGSNSGIYLQGRYEVQIFDSWGVRPSKVVDCGSIYERWDQSRPEGRQGYEGHPPAQNVSRAPGLWQHFRIEFRAPRFDSKGEKIANARFKKVIHNGVVIHENVEVTGPTRSAAFQDEKPFGPLMIQGDHGPVAFRNIRYKAYGLEAITLSDLKLAVYEGEYSSLSQLDTARTAAVMPISVLRHQGTGSMKQYGGKISGAIHVPKSGPNYFRLNLGWIPDDTNPESPNGGGELKIDGKSLIIIDGVESGSGSAVVNLEAGSHPIELRYYKKYGHWYQPSNDIVLGVEAPEIEYTNLNAELLFAEAVGAITVPVAGEPVMLRSFLNHDGKKKTHVISVGQPGAAHYSYDLAQGSLLQYWRGDFAETTLMWRDRGEPQLAEPMGSVVSLSGKPTVAVLLDQSAPWPDTNAHYNYLGYDVTGTGHPVIKYTIGDIQVKELVEAEDSGKKLSHTITVVAGETDGIWCHIAEGRNITRLANGLYTVNDKEYFIQLPDKIEPVIRNVSPDTMELLLPVKGRVANAIVKYSIIW